MKTKISWFSLFGIIVLSCNAFSPKASATAETQTSYAGNTEVKYQDGIPVQEFSLDNVNAIPPKDVLIQIEFFKGGGGGGDSYCKDESDVPYQYVQPTLYEPEDVEFMLATFIEICGWIPNQDINVKITYPNGTLKTEEYKTDDIGALTFSFAPKWGDPIGVYSFEISNRIDTFATNVLFYESKLPHIYYINQTQLLLENFRVGETLQLLAFKVKDHSPIGGMKVIIDDSNGKIVDIPSTRDYIYVGIDQVGVVYDSIDLNGYSVLDNLDSHVADWRLIRGEKYEQKISEYETVKNSRLACPTNTASILNDEELKFYKTRLSEIEFYFKPRLSAKAILLEKNQPIWISSNYYCFDNLVWRSIELPNLSGYILEKDFQPRMLEEQSCGELPTRLSSNQSARVSFANSNNKNVRKEPGFTEDIIAQIPEGTAVTVWNDWCVDNTHWWHIRTYTDNLDGWMTESQNGDYFLEPIQ
ncbi:MAG: SH3 domain-containing protein [Anaerolineales bacterium]